MDSLPTDLAHHIHKSKHNYTKQRKKIIDTSIIDNIGHQKYSQNPKGGREWATEERKTERTN